MTEGVLRFDLTDSSMGDYFDEAHGYEVSSEEVHFVLPNNVRVEVKAKEYGGELEIHSVEERSVEGQE